MTSKQNRNLALISGYYGFGNLGDEAILEEIIEEVKQLFAPENIYVLSNNPQHTSRMYGVKAVSRWKLKPLVNLLPQTKVFISGGGGLFQDTSSFKPPLFYGTQIALARMLGAKVFIFAQGVGPLKSTLSQIITKGSLAFANEITIRDSDSYELLKKWGLRSELTADPVWKLNESPLPPLINDVLNNAAGKNGGKNKGFIPYGNADKTDANGGTEEEKPLLVGLSLRESKNFSDQHLESLVEVLAKELPAHAQILLVALQKEQDQPQLEKFEKLWQKKGRQAITVNTVHLDKPSQWLNFFSRLDLLVGMRLHAVIMSLKSKVPVIGIAYDNKVTYVLKEFGQPILNLHKEMDAAALESWSESVKTGVSQRSSLSKSAYEQAERAKNLSGQNFVALSRILDMQSDH